MKTRAWDVYTKSCDWTEGAQYVGRQFKMLNFNYAHLPIQNVGSVCHLKINLTNGRDARKPVFEVSDQACHKPAFTVSEDG